MNPTVLGVIGPGFLNQVPTLALRVWGLGVWVFDLGSGLRV